MKEVQVGSLTTLVDDCDLETVNQHRWHPDRRPTTVYAKANLGHGKTLMMHRLIMGFPVGDVDHIDGNGLNNCRSNLRAATRGQNLANQRKFKGTFKYKGVYWSTSNKGWVVNICIDDRTVALGTFKSEEEAAQVYDKAVTARYGDYALTNAKLGLLAPVGGLQ